MRKLKLKCHLSPGDIVMLTAAVRDLHQCYPEQFKTAVDTSCPELWQNNPYIDHDPEDASSYEPIDCEYPLIHRSNILPYHFIHGFIDDLNTKLGLNIRPTQFQGDIHLNQSEKTEPSPIFKLTRHDIPYWIIVAGGKYDFTIKWWERSRFQTVVDKLEGKVVFVQVGQSNHYHPRLNGVIDLRGKTTTRELVPLVYHAQGVLCPVTFLMHLCAAIETPPPLTRRRPCVVIAGGREPPHWESYPWHHYLHTIGMLSCCGDNGCWRSRTNALGDGDPLDAPEHLCLDTNNGIPRCMDLIEARNVVETIEKLIMSHPATDPSNTDLEAASPYLTRDYYRDLYS